MSAAPPSSKRMRAGGEAGKEEAAGDNGADGSDASSSAAAPPAVLRPIPTASSSAAAESGSELPAPIRLEVDSPFVEVIPCISMVAGPGDDTSVLAVFWDRHSERLGEEGFMRHFTTLEACVLRLVCREFCETVDATAWNDLETRINGSLVDWRASFPNAIAANVSRRSDLVNDDFALFRGFHALNLSQQSNNLAPLAWTDASFVHLRGVRKLSMRNCNRAAITDAIFANLRGIEELDVSNCDQTAITTAGFEQLRGIETLIVDTVKQPLICAIQASNVPDAMRLIDEGNAMWINAIDTQKQSPLLWAAYYGLDAVVLRLLERGANVNAANASGLGPLYYACVNGRESIVRLLAAWGANVNLRALDGRTPIDFTNSATIKALLRSHRATD